VGGQFENTSIPREMEGGPRLKITRMKMKDFLKHNFLLKFCSDRVFQGSLNSESVVLGFKSASFIKKFHAFETEHHQNENARPSKRPFSIETSV
jgi:hypothetical protein